MLKTLSDERQRFNLMLFPHVSDAMNVAVAQGKAPDRSALANEAITWYLQEKLGIRSGKTVILVEQVVEVTL